MPVSKFMEAMTDAGLTPPPDISPDGSIHRFDVEGDRPHSKNGWYVLFDDPPAGAFGDWRRGIKETWSAKEYKALSPEKQAQHKANMEAAKRAREQEQERMYAECREACAAIWEQAKPAPADHPYLISKGVKPHGLKVYKGALLVPVRDGENLHGLQFISADGEKRFKSGTNKRGKYYSIGGRPTKVLYLAEGFATAATVHEATGHPVAVCFDAGNLHPVLSTLRHKMPKIQMILCADNDRTKEVNTGLVRATEAAQAEGALLAVPQFPEGVSGTDFNDLAQACGLEEVKRQVEACAEPSAEQSADSQADDEWEEPLLFGESKPPKIPTSLLPSWLAEYVQAVAASTQTPPEMAIMLALSTVAACLQGKVEVSPYGDDYKEPVCLWTVTALPPASRKTAVIGALTDPLQEWEKQEAERLADSIQEAKATKAINEARVKKLTEQAAKEEDFTQRQTITREILEIKENTPEQIEPPRLWTSDVTPERLQGLLVENGERMSLLSDEGGIFEIMGGLYSDGKVNLDVFLQAHAGKSVRVDRGKRMAHLNSPVLSFGLAVQPDIISSFSQGSKRKFRGNGALARFMYAMPESNIGRRDVRKRCPIPQGTKDKYRSGIFRLLEMEPDTDADGHLHPDRLTLNPEALESWLAFSQYVESNQGAGGEFEHIQDWTGKLPGAALRIAGLCHVVEHGQSISTINQQTIEKALDLAQLLIEHAKAAFEFMGADKESNDAKAVLSWIQRQNREEFTQRECHQGLRSHFAKSEHITNALDMLAGRGIVSAPTKEKTGGRPSIRYRVNPAVLREGVA